MDIPVYMFVGFLESGKTKFIQETLEDPRFNSGEKTLLLLCEEGMEEYDPSSFSGSNVFVHTVENEEDLNPKMLETLRKKYKFERAVVEYNGMWQINSLFAALPKNWVVYQCMMFACAPTFATYNANMRGLVVDKINCSEVVIFNRCDENTDKLALHKLVRGVSRRAEIAYEYDGGRVEYDEIEDPLPFDVNADVIEIEDRDFALWYRDMMEDLQKYNGKTVSFLGIAARDRKMPDNAFAIGRHIMTCCVEDITYGGVVCRYDGAKDKVKTGEWYHCKARIKIEKDELYVESGPVLYVSSLEKADAPAEKVATFY